VILTFQGILNDTLKNFLDQTFPSKKRGSVTLGVQEEKIGSAIQEALNLRCEVGLLVPLGLTI
jgi:hypothetical protein